MGGVRRTVLTLIIFVEQFLLNLVEWFSYIQVFLGSRLDDFEGEGSATFDGVVLDGPVIDYDELSEEEIR